MQQNGRLRAVVLNSMRILNSPFDFFRTAAYCILSMGIESTYNNDGRGFKMKRSRSRLFLSVVVSFIGTGYFSHANAEYYNPAPMDSLFLSQCGNPPDLYCAQDFWGTAYTAFFGLWQFRAGLLEECINNEEPDCSAEQEANDYWMTATFHAYYKLAYYSGGP